MSVTTELGANKLIPAVSYIASFFTALGGFITQMDVGLIVGIACALATAFVNWFYQKRKSLREERSAEIDDRIKERSAALDDKIKRLQAQVLLRQLEGLEDER
jgi:hypothetical protein